MQLCDWKNRSQKTKLQGFQAAKMLTTSIIAEIESLVLDLFVFAVGHFKTGVKPF